MKPGLEIAGWQEAHIGFENDGLRIEGVEVWKQAWRSAKAQPVELPHPAHPQQIHRYAIHEVGDADHPVRFAACELSNGVWGFYVPADRSFESQGVSTDGSLRYENRLGGRINDRPDSASSSAVLTDSTDGRVLLDCSSWASSRVTSNADGSLFLHLQQNAFEVLFGINPATRLFRNVVEPGPDQPLSNLAGAVEQARLAVIRQSAVPVSRHISPDGRVLVDLVAVEWSNTHWVNSPRVTDIASGSVVLDLWNTDWDATVSFPQSGRVRLGFRRYRQAGALTAELDLSGKTYRVFAGRMSNGQIIAEAANQAAAPEAPLADIGTGLEVAFRRVADIAALKPVHGSSYPVPRPHPLAAWRTALLILAAALVAIAAATFWSLHHAPASTHKLDVVPAMPK